MLPDKFTTDFLAKLQLFKLRSEKAFLGARQGGHISLKKGYGIEFSDFRKYEIGDDPRHIDWGVYARTDKLYVKRFQEERDISLLIVIDSSNSVLANQEKRESVINTALAVSYIALANMDSVVISIPGYLFSPKFRGLNSIYRIAGYINNSLKDLSQSRQDLKKEVLKAISAVKIPGLCLFLSDFLMEITDIAEIINLIRAKNLSITVVEVLSQLDISPIGEEAYLAVDSETYKEIELPANKKLQEEYLYFLEQHRNKMKIFFNNANIKHISYICGDSFEDFILKTLPITGLIR